MINKAIRKSLMLWRIIQAGARNFMRNAWLSIAATAVMVITLTIMLGALIFNMALSDTLDEVTSSIDIAVFFDDSAPIDTVKQLQADVENLDNVTATFYVDKAEALRRYRAENSENADILEAVSEKDNPLPTSLEVQVADLNRVDELIVLTQDSRYVDIVEDTSLGEDRRRTIERIAGTKNFLITSGIGASVIFAAVSILIIFNTIRMAIFARADELGIMRLVGATNSFIRGPFLFEAIMNGVLAAVITLAVVYAGLFRGTVAAVEFVKFDSTLSFFITMWPLVVGGTVLAGIAIGMLSSMLAMMRYLKL